MFFGKNGGLCVAGLCAGIVNGLFGAGGGMTLVPLLSLFQSLEENEVFSSSVAIILPICLVSLAVYLPYTTFSIVSALPYLSGSLISGIFAYKLGSKIPTKWLHRVLGIFILWGGIRYLC